SAFPEKRGERVADWPLGRRNRALAQIRCEYFGPTLAGWTACPKCGEKLEFSTDGRAFAQSQEPTCEENIIVTGPTFRLPTSRHLARVAGLQDPSLAALRLLEACRVDAKDDTQTKGTNDLEQDAEQIGERMAQADPLAEIVITFLCPLCGETCNEALDLPTF